MASPLREEREKRIVWVGEKIREPEEFRERVENRRRELEEGLGSKTEGVLSVKTKKLEREPSPHEPDWSRRREDGGQAKGEEERVGEKPAKPSRAAVAGAPTIQNQGGNLPN
jgi:hypothetical protein